MSLSIENTGFCIFGADPDASPPTPNGAAAVGAKFPPSGALCVVTVKWKGGAKIDKAKGAGKSGGKQTFTGSKVAEASLTIKYPDREPHASAIEAALLVISPHGPNKGKAWDFVERFAPLYDVHAVMVEEMDFEPAEGSDDMHVKIKLSGWDKKQQTNSGAGSGSTPKDSQRYTVPGFGGGGSVQFPSKPTVVPNP